MGNKNHDCEEIPDDAWITYDSNRKYWIVESMDQEYGIEDFTYCPWCGQELR